MAKGKGTSVILGEHFDSFISEQVEAGRFGNASEVIRQGLRLLEEQQTKLQALQAALKDGEDSGPAEDFDPDAFLKEMHLKHAKDL